MKILLLTLLLLLLPVPVVAQSTILIDADSALGFAPSPDHSTTFGTPAVPVLTSYRAEFFLRSQVSGGVPTGTPTITVDLGKPTPVSGTITSAPLRPMVQPNLEYIGFVLAVGPGGVSGRSNATDPFGYAAAPRGVTGAVVVP